MSSTPKFIRIDVPAATYTDGTITATIIQASQPIISKISLEQKTVSDSGIETPVYADLSLVKTDNLDPVLAGSSLQYLITVTNNGPDAASDVSVMDTLPSGGNLVTTNVSQGTVYSETGSLVCNLRSLTTRHSATLTVNTSTFGQIMNTVSVISNVVDMNTDNNSASPSTTVTPKSVQFDIYLPALIR